MRRLSFNRLAERELAEAAGYYEKESPGLGERFLDEARSALFVLQRYPDAAPKVFEEIRRFTFPRFPYYFLYKTTGGDSIRVLAIAHQKRHPRYWIGRS